jgi:hypothetical protein
LDRARPEYVFKSWDPAALFATMLADRYEARSANGETPKFSKGIALRIVKID